MAKMTATLVHVTGYENGNPESPILKYSEYVVDAETEREAIEKAKTLDNTSYSVYESFAS